MHEMHKDPKSGAILCVSQCVSVSVCHETTRGRSLRYNKLAGRLGTSNRECLFFKYHSFVGHCCHCFLHILGTVSPVLGKFWGALRRKLVAFVQGKLSCISKLLCRAVFQNCSVELSMVSFLSKISYTTLPCLFLFISFRFLLSGVLLATSIRCVFTHTSEHI